MNLDMLVQDTREDLVHALRKLDQLEIAEAEATEEYHQKSNIIEQYLIRFNGKLQSSQKRLDEANVLYGAVEPEHWRISKQKRKIQIYDSDINRLMANRADIHEAYDKLLAKNTVDIAEYRSEVSGLTHIISLAMCAEQI